MKKNFKTLKSILVLALALILALSVFTGCKKNDKVGYNTKKSDYGSTYPIKGAEDVVLTYWRQTTAAVQKSAPKNYGDLPFAKELEKQTGIKIEYIHPSLTNATEKFNLMLSSGNLTDILGYNFNSYTGGAQAAIDDGVIHALNVEGNSILDAWAPDFKALLDEFHDTVGKEAKTDNGYYFAFGIVAPERSLNTTAGPIVRKDWLDDLGLDVPKTVDDWYTMLKAFKEKKGATAPLSMSDQGFHNGFISGAYGVNKDFFHDNGTVKYAPAEQGYKKYLETMHKWYKEGLFDREFDTTTTVTQNLLTGKSGATWNALGGGIGTLMSNVEAKEASDPNKDAVFIGAPYPTLDGSKSQFGQASARFSPNTSISTKCKSAELAAKWLNYAYTEKGHMLYNFGIEGVSYEMVDKDGDGVKEYPQYTEEVTNNPNLTMQEAFVKYSQAGGGGGNTGYRQDVRYLEQYANRPIQAEAWKTWCDTDAFDHYVPNTGVSEDEAKEYSTLYTNISTYVGEEYIKFVKGKRPISEFDDFVKTLKDMGLDKMIAMKQAAFDRFNAR